ncbi:MAG: hypothetical protein H6Q85_2052 [candidate division NC10 bacterium]|nr:hypothetical protein [candidate division NC10 bacterium]
MIRKKILQAGLGVALATAGLLASGGAASAAGVDRYDGQWHYSLTPYAWFPNIHQTLQFNTPLGGGKTVEVEVKPDSYLSDLDFALMGAFEARQGDWALAMDLIYNDFSDQKGKIKTVRGPGGNLSLPIDTNLNVDLQALIWEGIGSYTVARSPAGTLDVFGGVRYLGLETSTDLSFSGPDGVLGRSGSTSDRVNVWDGIVGARGAVGAFRPRADGRGLAQAEPQQRFGHRPRRARVGRLTRVSQPTWRWPGGSGGHLAPPLAELKHGGFQGESELEIRRYSVFPPTAWERSPRLIAYPPPLRKPSAECQAMPPPV